MTSASAKWRNVKGEHEIAVSAADVHERAKDFQMAAEIDRLLEAAKTGRHGPRDHLLVLIMYRHWLRVSEAVAIRRDEIDLATSRLWVRRLKNGLLVEQPVAGDELRPCAATSAYAATVCLGYLSPSVVPR